jgi:poly-gamma-glutamate synthesis protein (capsule biosynthesis protein)
MSPTATLAFVGDIMLDELPGEAIAAGRDPFEAFAAILARADYVIGNLECVIATGGEKVDKPFNFRAHPRCIPVLKRHFDAVSLANNHSGDYGKDALVECFQLLKDGEVPYFGAGNNVKEAHQPLLIEPGGLRIAVLGYNEFNPRSFTAGPDAPGCAWSEDDLVVADIKAARKEHKADLVIPFMHWGREYREATDRQRQFARTMIDAGADVVVGAHPHVTQGAEEHGGKPIVYSLGHFCFNGFERPASFIGWALRLTLDKQGVVAWDTVLARLDEQGIPVPDFSAGGPCGRTDCKTVNYCRLGR